MPSYNILFSSGSVNFLSFNQSTVKSKTRNVLQEDHKGFTTIKQFMKWVKQSLSKTTAVLEASVVRAQSITLAR